MLKPKACTETSAVFVENLALSLGPAEDSASPLGSTVQFISPPGFTGNISFTLGSWKMLLLAQPSWRTAAPRLCKRCLHHFISPDLAPCGHSTQRSRSEVKDLNFGRVFLDYTYCAIVCLFFTLRFISALFLVFPSVVSQLKQN